MQKEAAAEQGGGRAARGVRPFTEGRPAAERRRHEPVGEWQPSARGRLRAADVCDVEPARSPTAANDTHMRATFKATARPVRTITRKPTHTMKIICIGRNYDDHIAEKENGGGGTRPEHPLFFLKPDTALLRNNDPFYLPAFSNEIHYECELVVRINRVGRAIERRFAHRYYDEVGLGIDFTARDLQRRAIAEGLPWESCKSFDHSAAVSPRFLSLAELGGDIQRLHFDLSLNGEPRQAGDTARMLWTVDEQIAWVSQFVLLRMGDLLFTGTPAGVGCVAAGDTLRASLEGRELLNFDIR